MKTKWIGLFAPALVALALAGVAEAGGYGPESGHHGPVGAYDHQDRGRYRDTHRGHSRGYAHDRRPALGRQARHYRPAYRSRAIFRHGYRQGYRTAYRSYRHGYFRSSPYYPDAYVFDPVLGHVRGVYYPHLDY